MYESHGSNQSWVDTSMATATGTLLGNVDPEDVEEGSRRIRWLLRHPHQGSISSPSKHHYHSVLSLRSECVQRKFEWRNFILITPGLGGTSSKSTGTLPVLRTG